MVKAVKPGLDIRQSCSVPASHWVKDVELETLIYFLAPGFALIMALTLLVVQCINATAVFSNGSPTFNFLYNCSYAANLSYKVIKVCFYVFHKNHNTQSVQIFQMKLVFFYTSMDIYTVTSRVYPPFHLKQKCIKPQVFLTNNFQSQY